ncbi:MAG: YcxB family protein [Cyanobacteria bacterium J06621_8]
MNKTIIVKHLWKINNVIVGYKYYKKSLTSYHITTLFGFIIGIFNIFLGVYLILSNESRFAWDSLFCILTGIFLLSMNKINLIYFIHRMKRTKYENKQLEWEISEDKIVYRMLNLLETTLNWELIKGIIDTPQGFLILQPNLYYWLPKNAFNNDEDIAQFLLIAQDQVKNWQKIK